MKNLRLNQAAAQDKLLSEEDCYFFSSDSLSRNVGHVL